MQSLTLQTLKKCGFCPCICPEVLRGVRLWLESWLRAFEELVREENKNVQRKLHFSENGYRVEYLMEVWLETDDPFHTIVVFRVFPAKNSLESGVHWAGEGAKMLYEEKPLYSMALNILQLCSDYKGYVDPKRAAEESLTHLKIKMGIYRDISEQIQRLREDLVTLTITLVVTGFFVNIAANFFVIGDLWNTIKSLFISGLIITIYAIWKTFRKAS